MLKNNTPSHDSIKNCQKKNLKNLSQPENKGLFDFTLDPYFIKTSICEQCRNPNNKSLLFCDFCGLEVCNICLKNHENHLENLGSLEIYKGKLSQELNERFIILKSKISSNITNIDDINIDNLKISFNHNERLNKLKYFRHEIENLINFEIESYESNKKEILRIFKNFHKKKKSFLDEINRSFKIFESAKEKKIIKSLDMKSLIINLKNMLGEVNDILNFKNKFQNHLDDNLDLTKKMNNLETIMDKTELEIVTMKNIMINFKNVENLEFHKSLEQLEIIENIDNFKTEKSDINSFIYLDKNKKNSADVIMLDIPDFTEENNEEEIDENNYNIDPDVNFDLQNTEPSGEIRRIYINNYEKKYLFYKFKTGILKIFVKNENFGKTIDNKCDLPTILEFNKSIFLYEDNLSILKNYFPFKNSKFTQINENTLIFTGGKCDINGKESFNNISFKLSVNLKDFFLIKKCIITVNKFPELIIGRFNHAMIYLKYFKSIFVISGESTNTCEVFNLSDNEKKWKKFPNLNFIRINPTVFVMNDDLIFVFGCPNKLNDFKSYYEVISLSTPNKWNLIILNKEFKYNNFNSMGYVQKSKKEIILIGGYKLDNSISEDTLLMDFDEKGNLLKFSIENNKLTDKMVFECDNSFKLVDNDCLVGFPSNTDTVIFNYLFEYFGKI